MKKILIISMIVFAAGFSSAQTVYVPSGTGGIGSSTNSNVGIGTTSTPGAKLEVVGSGNGNVDIKVNGRIMSGDAGYQGGMWVNNPNTMFVGALGSNKIGLYNTLWGLSLDASGNTQIAGYLNVQGLRIPGRYNFSATGIESAIELEIPAGSYNAIRGVIGTTMSSSIHFFDPTWYSGSANASAGAINIDGATAVTLGVWNSPLAYFRKSDGFIGFGTTNPDARLSVKGQVHAQEVKVDLNGAIAPDYVFAKEYKLPSLDKLKEYIEQYQHLPEVPSAKEMDANGINVGEMNLLLLKKIEELTLYVIELKKEVDQLKLK
ncbi:MAG: hypothetical protein WDO14_17225 [Bacteroidota bacterium]